MVFYCVFWYYFFFCDLDDNNLQATSRAITSFCVSYCRRECKRLKIHFDGYRGMFDQSLSNSKDLGDMIRLLPGVVVQKNLSMQGMADLYRIKPDFLKRLESIELLKPSPKSLLYPSYILDDYLSDFLQDRDRSQLYYCNPELQHISICRQILSLSYQSNIFDLQS